MQHPVQQQQQPQVQHAVQQQQQQAPRKTAACAGSASKRLENVAGLTGGFALRHSGRSRLAEEGPEHVKQKVHAGPH